MLISRAVALAIPGQTRGDIIYYNGTSWARLPIGTLGQVLSTDGDVPQWVTPAPAGAGGKYRFNGTRADGGPALTLTIPDFFPFAAGKVIEINAAQVFTPTIPGAATYESLYLRTMLLPPPALAEVPGTRAVSADQTGGPIFDLAALSFAQSGTSLLVTVDFTAGGAVGYRISFNEA